MYRNGGSDLAPAFAPTDPGVAGYRVRGYISMAGVDRVRRFFGVLAQAKADANDFVLVLRGTRSRADYIANSMFGLRDFSDVIGGGNVHRGWYDLFKSASVMAADPSVALSDRPDRPGFVGDVAALIDAYRSEDAHRSRDRSQSLHARPAVRLTVTGHSVGAALLTMFAVKNASIEGTIRPSLMCTLASPMVGDRRFAARFDAISLDSRRIVVDRDTVPKLPGNRWGYRHVGGETVLALTGGLRSPRRVHDIRTYQALIASALELEPRISA